MTRLIAYWVFVCILATCYCQCIPGNNCKLPDCRCWFDDKAPGDFGDAETPQMVLVTFEEAVNKVNVDLYKSLFTENNPNGCPGWGTFFIKDQDTDYTTVKILYDEGHEIGAGSLNGETPLTMDEWKLTLKTIKTNLVDSGIKSDDITGVRAPLLKEGGFNQFIGMGDNKYVYDASCITSEFDTKEEFKWPYTYDFLPTPMCNDGSPPDTPFPGKWQFLIPSLRYQGAKCATPSGCTAATTQRDIFDLLLENFESHYTGSRSPFVLVIQAEFVATPFKLSGLTEFLEYITAGFDDVWVVTMNKALQWMQDPTPVSNLTSFQPWKC